MTDICVSKLTIIGSVNGLSPGRRRAIIWTNAEILLIRTLGTNFSEIRGKIHSFSFNKMHLEMSSANGRLFTLGLNELKRSPVNIMLSCRQHYPTPGCENQWIWVVVSKAVDTTGPNLHIGYNTLMSMTVARERTCSWHSCHIWRL